MKLVKVICYLFFLMLLGLQYSKGQQWLWGSQGVWKTNNTYYQSDAIAVDKHNNTFITGFGFDTVVYGADTLKINFVGFFVAKYDSTGIALWASQSVQKSNDASIGDAIITDNEGNIYIAGSFKDTVSFGSYSFIFNGIDNYCPFIVKYSNNGNVIWAKIPILSSTYCYGNAISIATDKSNNLYVTGNFFDTISFGSNVLISNGASGVFLAKYDSNGNVLWAQQSNIISNPVSSSAVGNSITVDASGNVYVTGNFSDSVSFGSHLLIAPRLGSEFLVKYDPNGNVIWAEQSTTTHHSKGYSYGTSVITDKAENIYVTGSFSDTLYFGSCVLTAISNKYDAETFLTKYAPNGSIEWAKQSMNAEEFYGPLGNCNPILTIDTNNHIYFIFLANDSNFDFGGYLFNRPLA